MNFFRQVDLDWMGKAKFFIGLSLTLLVIGAISCVVKGGLRYGIDFKRGTVVYVRFAQAPPIDRIRQGLGAQALGDSTIQRISDLANPNTNEVVIGLEHGGEGAERLGSVNAANLRALRQTCG